MTIIRRTVSRLRVSSLLVAICAAASGAVPTFTLILGAPGELGPIAGIPSNLSYTPVSGTIADLNGDGAPDIVIGMNGAPPVVYLNNGSLHPFDNVAGVFVAAPPGPTQSGISWGATEIVDANADGRPDLAIAGFNGPNHVYLNNGTATPFNGAADVTIGASEVGLFTAFGDVNGDGFPDLANADTNHEPSRIYLTQGAPLTSGSYATRQIGTELGYGQDTKLGDVNGDGKLDVALTYTIGTIGSSDPTGIAIYLNNGSSDPFNNVTPSRLLLEKAVFSVAFADLNHDGKTDLVASSSDAAVGPIELRVFLNTGSAVQPFVDAQLLQVSPRLGGGCLSVSVGEVNGDAFPDLLFACTAPDTSNGVPLPAHAAVGVIYLNNGTATPFANVAPVDIPAKPGSGYARSVAVGALVAQGERNVLLVDGGSPVARYLPVRLAQDPMAQNDSKIVAVDGSARIDVLANDTAAPGQTLDIGTVRITVSPLHGTFIRNADGTVTYAPTTGYTGADRFEYTVCDDLGVHSNAAVVSVTVRPRPVAANDTATTQANQDVTIDILANDHSDGGTLDANSISVDVAPAHGATSLSNGKVLYTPTTGYSGADTFQYSVQDDLGTTSNAATVSIQVAAPVANPPPAAGKGGGAMSTLDLAILIVLLLLRCAWPGRTTAPASLDRTRGPREG